MMPFTTVLRVCAILSLIGSALAFPLDGDKSESAFIKLALKKRIDVSQTKPMDVAQCYWTSYTGAVGWMITMPQFDGKSVKDMKGDMIGSLHNNAACAGVTAMIGHKEWYAVGKHNTTAGYLFVTSDFCTAWQMTNVIKAATGKKQDTACQHLTENSDDPKGDPGSLAYDSFGNDGGDDSGDLRRRAAPESSAKSKHATSTKNPSKTNSAKASKSTKASKSSGTAHASGSPLGSPASSPSKPSDAEMAKLLDMPSDSSHEALIKKLQGPSPLDKKTSGKSH